MRYTSGVIPTNYTYTGQYSYTGSFGLMYYREASRAASRRADNARWYDPSLGRFAQADTIVPPGVQGLDRYAYVNNSPLNYVDPSGHCPEEEDWCISNNASTSPYMQHLVGSAYGGGNSNNENQGGEEHTITDVYINSGDYFEIIKGLSTPTSSIDILNVCDVFMVGLPLFCSGVLPYSQFGIKSNPQFPLHLPHPSGYASMAIDIGNAWLDAGVKIPGIIGMGIDYSSQMSTDKGKGYSPIEGNLRALAVVAEGQFTSYVSAGGSGLSVIGTVETGPGVVAVAVGVYIGSNIALSSMFDSLNSRYIFPAISDISN